MSTPLLITSLDEVFQHGEGLLHGLKDSQYAQKVPEAFASSIGAHYRHHLEHIQLLLAAWENEGIDYDLRERNSRIENERLFALEFTRQLRARLHALDFQTLERPFRAKCKTSYTSQEPAVAESTLEREIMYTISHAVHHYALIGLICSIQKIPLPEGFGVAPSTVAYQQKTAAS